MIKCERGFKVPKELELNDVYDLLYLFEDEKEAVAYVSKEYDIDMDNFLAELHEDDNMREEFGKENYLRCAEVNRDTILSELMNGNYILWEAY